MTRKMLAVTALAAGAISLTGVAAAQPDSTSQRVSIDVKGADASSFVLTPLSSGGNERERGTAAFCCWSTKQTMRDGQALEVNNPQMTLTGKNGTLVTRNQIEWIDIPGSSVIFTGTWNVVSGTGAYAGMVGGGLAAGIESADGQTRSRFTGHLTRRSAHPLP